MAYQIKIIPSENYRNDEAWKKAVDETEGVRLVDYSVNLLVNPKTGEEIRIGGSLMDAEIYFSEEMGWYRALYWRGGEALINARFEIGNKNDPAWLVVMSLAGRLNAIVQGEEGEVFDLE